ncbi:MAG: rhomboid family intramembrane serine protease [Cytophagaceae bacterium]|nr:rhomboid family intramembrane serine protease [Cytophagaceae bacterium]
MLRLTPVVRNILIINIAIFAAGALLQRNFAPAFGLHYIYSQDFQPYQFLTHMFLHGGFGHLFTNMFGLIIFGPLLEQVWGAKRFLLFYLVTGIGAGVLYSGVNYFEMAQLQQTIDLYKESPSPLALNELLKEGGLGIQRHFDSFLRAFEARPEDPTLLTNSFSVAESLLSFRADVPMVGASGAIFGILAAFGLLFPNTELFLLFFPFPIKAKYFVALYGLYELYAGVHNAQGDNVAHFAHIGGMIFAFVLVKYWGSQRKKFY